MTPDRPAGSFWPSRPQRLLLEAALGDPAEALAAWRELLPGFDLQTIDDASFAVLPLVYRSLEASAPDEPLLPRLKGIYRSVWARNTLLVERLRATVGAFAAAEVPVLLVGSIGLALRSYPALGYRPTPFVELLVAEQDVLGAVKALGISGWVPREPGRRPRSASLILFDDHGNVCLLRSALAGDLVGVDADEPLRTIWAAASPLDGADLPVVTLAPTDELLTAIVTGARATPLPTLQWIVDAAMVLRAQRDEIDWDRLVTNGLRWGQAPRLRDAFRYLDGLSGVGVPADARRVLDASRSSRRDRLAYACTARSVWGLGSLPQALGEHVAQSSGLTAVATAAAFPAFLRDRWQLDCTRQLPVAGARRVVRDVTRRRGGTVHER